MLSVGSLEGWGRGKEPLEQEGSHSGIHTPTPINMQGNSACTRGQQTPEAQGEDLP